jgi:hypothetical protein
VADGVTSLSQGVGELSTGQRRNADALMQMLEQVRAHDAAIERVTARLQAWMLFATCIAAGSTLACLLLAWAMMSGR